MELVLVGGLALLGHEFSKNGKKSRKQPEKIKKVRFENEFPIKDDTTLQGTVELNKVPYYRSERAMNTWRDEIKQDRLERFIGTTDYVYQSKVEQEPLFKPTEMKMRVGSDGRRINPVSSENNRVERYVVTGKMDGVRPIPQEHVGRGLNTDKTAKGGFHDMTRILPENANSYTKQTFTGRMIPGRALTNERPQTVRVDSNRPERLYTQDKRPAIAGKSDFTAGNRRGEYMVQCTNRGYSNDYLVGPAGDVDGHTVSVQGDTRVRDSTLCTPHGNPGQGSAGNYTTGKYIVPGTERGQCGTVTNVAGNSGNSVYTANAPGFTMRDIHQDNKYRGNVTSDVKGGWTTAPSVQMTTRETTGAAKASGPAFGNYGTNTYSLKDATEASTKAGGRAFAPPPGRRNELGNPGEIMQNALVREDANANRSTGGLRATGLNNYKNLGQIGKIEETHGLPSANHRTVLDIAKSQLDANPFNHSIN
tara:strand:- start:272 stop:1702 length:1431 start_codon:yes stop_codon:yes gene_type:complete